MDVVKNVVLVKNVTKGAVSFSGVSEGDRSAVSGHGQLRGVLSAVLYTYTCVPDRYRKYRVVMKSVTKGPVSYSGVLGGGRSAVSGHGQLRGILYGIRCVLLYTYTCIQD